LGREEVRHTCVERDDARCAAEGEDDAGLESVSVNELFNGTDRGYSPGRRSGMQKGRKACFVCQPVIHSTTQIALTS
jgi:hypothetical protein